MDRFFLSCKWLWSFLPLFFSFLVIIVPACCCWALWKWFQLPALNIEKEIGSLLNVLKNLCCRFADTASSSLKSQHVLYARLLRIFGFVSSVVLLAVEGKISLSLTGCVWNSFLPLYVLHHFLEAKYLCSYKGGHAIIHWKETQHCYSLELETQRVWDYVGDNYVHRLIQSKTGGMLVELNSHCLHGNDGYGSCNCVDSTNTEAIMSCKAEVVNFQYFNST